MYDLEVGDKVWVHTDYHNGNKYSYFGEILPTYGEVTHVGGGGIHVKIGFLSQAIHSTQFIILTKEELKIEDFV